MMTYTSDIREVKGVDEFRRQLGAVLRRIREQAEDAEPVVFGNNRKPEAAVVPVGRLIELERAEEQLEDLALAMIAQQRRGQPVEGTVSDFFEAAGLDPAEVGLDGE